MGLKLNDGPRWKINGMVIIRRIMPIPILTRDKLGFPITSSLSIIGLIVTKKNRTVKMEKR
jgi:hypothetical protein